MPNYFKVYARIFDDTEFVGLLCPIDHTLRELGEIRFRNDGRPVSINDVYAKDISQSEFESYKEFGIPVLTYGSDYFLDCGIRIIMPEEPKSLDEWKRGC